MSKIRFFVWLADKIADETNLYNALFKIFSRTRLYVWLMSKIVSKVNFQVIGYTKYPPEDYFKWREAAVKYSKDRNIVFAFCSSADKSLATMVARKFLKCYWGHAGILVLGKRLKDDRFVHMQSKGITVEHPLRVLKRIDSLSIQAFDVKSKANLDEAMERVNRAIIRNKRYDFTSEMDNNVWYCSEAVYHVGIGLSDNIRLNARLGRRVFEPDDVVQQGMTVYEWRSSEQEVKGTADKKEH